jgi:hypothetical protein
MAAEGPPGEAVVVVTRLVVRWAGELPSEEWLRRRVELMLRITAPALQAQTAHGIAWLLQAAPERLDLAAQLCAGLRLPGGVVRVIGADVKGPQLPDIHPGAQRFLTFRLDSDDAIDRRTVEQVLRASAAHPHGAPLFNLPAGYQLDWASGALYERVIRPDYQGPFLALRNQGRAAMLHTGGHHRRARRGRDVVEVPEARWLQTIHGGNILNRLASKRSALTEPRRAAALAEFRIRR